MNITDKQLVLTLAEALRNDYPHKITKTTVDISKGTKTTFVGDDDIKLEFRAREGKGVEMFARGDVLNDVGLRYYASSGEAGKPETLEQVFTVLRRMLGK